LPRRAHFWPRPTCLQHTAVTGITLQVPFEVQSDGPQPVLRISENGKPTGSVFLRPVTDNVHVINTCDDTQVFVSAAYTVPQSVCTPAVPGFGITSAPAFAAAFGDSDSYQVNFIVPPVPAGLPACDGVKIKSNLTVTITGANSYDAPQLCVAP
jgi:hypothetical protein